jgi:hypothetical protein
LTDLRSRALGHLGRLKRPSPSWTGDLAEIVVFHFLDGSGSVEQSLDHGIFHGGDDGILWLFHDDLMGCFMIIQWLFKHY